MGAVTILKSVVLTIILSISAREVVGSSNYYRVQLMRRESALSPLMKAHNLTKAQRMHISLERSKRRRERLQAQARGGIYYSPLNPVDGGFIMQMGIGSPKPLLQHMLPDTGSDLIWLQCKPCTFCYKQDDPFYDPLKSSSYKTLSCKSKLCAGSERNFCEHPDTCGYNYGYGDGANTTGVMAREAFSLKRTSTASSLGEWEALPAGLLFGCGHQQMGGPSTTIPGLVGLGRGFLSLVSQLGKNIHYIFSYCLGPVDDDAGISSLFLGAAPLPGNFQSTPFVGMTNPNYQPSLYYLDLQGISVGGTMVQYPASTFQRGGLIIDSGSTLTSLVDPAYKPFMAAVRSSIKAEPESDDPLCYHADKVPISKLPRIAFHFAGNATFVVPPRNSVYFDEENVCLAYGSAGGEGETSIFGNIQQQNYNFIYDLAKNKLSFAPAVCNNL